jgi:hypothetical protein
MPRDKIKFPRHVFGEPYLPEDRIRARMMDQPLPKRRRRGRVPAPRVTVTPAQAIGRSEVQTRLMRAMKTLRAIPDREKALLRLRSSSPDYIQEAGAYNSEPAAERPFTPTPRDLSDYLTALSWTRHLHEKDWRVLWLRSFDFSFGLIAEFIGRSDETARRRFDAIITDVWCTANNIAA